MGTCSSANIKKYNGATGSNAVWCKFDYSLQAIYLTTACLLYFAYSL